MPEKILVSLLVWLSAALSLPGQSRFSSVAELMDSFPKDSCVTASYRLTVTAPGAAKIAYDGEIRWQDGLFRIEGDGYSIFCDGTYIWTVDTVAREIVRERAVPVESLIPVSGSQSTDSFKVETPSGGSGAPEISFTMKNGAAVNIAVPQLNLAGSMPQSYFTCDTDSVPDDYVITILD